MINTEMQHVSTDSSPTPTKGVELRRTFDDFHSASAEWQDEVASFFDDLDCFLLTQTPPAAAPSQKLEADVAGLRALVEQQTEVLSALVNTLAGADPSPEAALGPEDTDEVVEAFFDRVEQLQHAAAEQEHASV